MARVKAAELEEFGSAAQDLHVTTLSSNGSGENKGEKKTTAAAPGQKHDRDDTTGMYCAFMFFLFSLSQQSVTQI
jgi:hypothetical protein